MPVEAALEVIVGVRPQLSSEAGYAITFEIENLGGFGDVEVHQVFAVSPAWKWTGSDGDRSITGL